MNKLSMFAGNTWDIPIEVDIIRELTFNQIKANSIATVRRGYA